MGTVGLGFTYNHPEHGEREATLSEHTRSTLEVTYAADPIRNALRKHGVNAHLLPEVVAWLRQQLTKSWVLGCSGFATVMADDDYSADRAVLTQLYEYMKHNYTLPVLTTDGGTGAGALQANADVARQFGVSTLGCTPISALAKDHIGPRTRTIVGGANYQEREELVGTLPDILLCLDGKDGTLREAEVAASHGSIVVLVSLRDYSGGPIDTYLKMEHLRREARRGRVIRCRWREEDVIEAFKTALMLRERIGSAGRRNRIKEIEKCILS